VLPEVVTAIVKTGELAGVTIFLTAVVNVYLKNLQHLG